MEDQNKLPKGWKVQKISELIVKTELINPTINPEKEFEYIDVSSVSNEAYRIIYSTKTLGKNASSRARKLVKSKDVIFATVRPTLRRVAIVPSELNNQVCSTGYCVLRAKEEEALAEFIFFSLLTSKFMGTMSSLQKGASYPAVSDSEVKSCFLAVPPSHERNKIVYILSTLQKAIQKQDELIDTTKALKKSLLHKFFTEGTKGEELKASPIGQMPVSWNLVKIGSLGKVVTGSTPKTAIPENYSPGEYDFIAPFDIGANWMVKKSVKQISALGLSVSRVLPKNSVLAVCIGSTIGKVGLTTQEKSATNQQINAIVCDEKVNNPHFIYYLLNYYNEVWKGDATPSPVPILTKGQFEKILIPNTSDLEEQNSIANSLMVFEKKLSIHQKKKLLYAGLFKTLLNELMTGSIRVNDIDFHSMLSAADAVEVSTKTITA